MITPYGIVCTDEFSSSVYLITNGEMKKIITAPGCGRYMTLSFDQKTLGFKFIDPLTRMQSPAVCHLQSLVIEKLAAPAELCGQPSFAGDGTIVFTVGSQLVIKKESSVERYDLGVYSNRTPVSPDGRYVIYNNDDQLWKYEPATETKELLTDAKAGYGDAQWSFDGSRLSFQSIDARILVKNLVNGETVVVSDGENARWAPDANTLVFHKRDIDMTNMLLNNSDIFLYDAGMNNLAKLTNTPGIKEMDASFSGGDIVCQTCGSREILKISLDTKANTVLFKSSQALEIGAFMEIPAAKTLRPANVSAVDWEYVHIHQVLQTGTNSDWYSGSIGYACCGASSALEAIASYKILPPDPIYSYHYGIYSPYGKYISDPYTYNGVTYAGYGGSWMTGAHGCLWNNGSPYSNIVTFLTNYGISSTRTDDVTWTSAMTEINLGYPYIVCSTGLTAAHIVMIVKQYGTGHTVYVNDPYGDKNPNGYNHSKLDGKNAIYDWSDANTGHQQITPLPWAVSARYQRREQLQSTYPKNNQTNIIPTAAVKLQFSEPVLPASAAENISLLGTDGKNAAFTIDTSLCSSGLVIVEPKQRFADHAEYTVVIAPALQSTNALTLLTQKQFSFTTGTSQAAVTGRTVIDFEDGAVWPDPDNTTGTVGTIAAQTFFAVDNNHHTDGKASGKLTYVFTSTTGGVCYLKNPFPTALGASADTSFGMWIFGDASTNLLGYVFVDAQLREKIFYVDTLNWTGWKFAQIQLSSIADTGKKMFAGIVVKQASLGLTSGSIFLDQAELFQTAVTVRSYSPSVLTKVDTLSPVAINFNKAMDRQKCQSAFSIVPQTAGAFAWDNNDARLTFIPAGSLKRQTAYTVTVDTSAADVNGLHLKTPCSFSFTTIRVRLMLLKKYPAALQSEISKTVQIRLTFDGAIAPSSLANNVSLTDASDKALTVKVNSALYAAGIIIFTPGTALSANAQYKIKLKSGIMDTEKLALGENIDIPFFTEASTYCDGAIADSFETVSNWMQPAVNVQSSNVDAAGTALTLSTAIKCSGDAAGKLAYAFSGREGLCVMEKTSGQAIHADGSTLFGMWVYGDLSGNILEYRFKDNAGGTLTCAVDTVNWTGWKIMTIALKDKNIAAFSAIALRQMNGAETAGELYFDNLQVNTATSVPETAGGVPIEYALGNNYPNPFNPATTISYSLPFAGRVTLTVYDILGNEVARLVNGTQPAGYRSVRFDASAFALSSGVYVYRISASASSGTQGFVQSKTMMLVK